jgi:hypothetical protein
MRPGGLATILLLLLEFTTDLVYKARDILREVLFSNSWCQPFLELGLDCFSRDFESFLKVSART